VLWCEELARLTRCNRRTWSSPPSGWRRYNLHLVAGTTHSSAELQALGWDEGGLLRLFDTGLGVPTLAELKDEVPDIATHLLTQLMESDEACPCAASPPRHSTPCASMPGKAAMPNSRRR
jgi:two-component system nitrogen regulation response regulator NtrX